jgi:hypothetical protein
MYANWSLFTLKGRPLQALKNVNIRPNPNGSCNGSRYVCVDVAQRQWNIEADQAAEVSPHKSFNDYAGSFTASMSLGHAIAGCWMGRLERSARGNGIDSFITYKTFRWRGCVTGTLPPASRVQILRPLCLTQRVQPRL